DHGMTNEGNHGGNTRDETHTPLIFISTNPVHHSLKPINSQKTHLQIDFAPTIASLFHFEIPSASQGQLILDVLDRFQEPEQSQLGALFKNALQIQHVIKLPNDGQSLQKEIFEKMKETFEKAVQAQGAFITNPANN